MLTFNAKCSIQATYPGFLFTGERERESTLCSHFFTRWKEISERTWRRWRFTHLVISHGMGKHVDNISHFRFKETFPFSGSEIGFWSTIILLWLEYANIIRQRQIQILILACTAVGCVCVQEETLVKSGLIIPNNRVVQCVGHENKCRHLCPHAKMPGIYENLRHLLGTFSILDWALISTCLIQLYMSGEFFRKVYLTKRNVSNRNSMCITKSFNKPFQTTILIRYNQGYFRNLKKLINPKA